MKPSRISTGTKVETPLLGSASIRFVLQGEGMKEFVATLYFDSAENALEAGYCEAVESDMEDGSYMSVISSSAMT